MNTTTRYSYAPASEALRSAEQRPGPARGHSCQPRPLWSPPQARRVRCPGPGARRAVTTARRRQLGWSAGVPQRGRRAAPLACEAVNFAGRRRAAARAPGRRRRAGPAQHLHGRRGGLHGPGFSRDFYLRKRSEGLRHVQAVLALARRRVDVLWAMFLDGRLYTPAPPPPAAIAARGKRGGVKGGAVSQCWSARTPCFQKLKVHVSFATGRAKATLPSPSRFSPW